MSTDETGSGTDGGTRSRRARPAIAAVVAAVLLAGGGGVYMAATAGEGAAGGRGAERSVAAEPPPLELDGSTEGGEPGPGGATYVAAGALPEGPGKAAVYQVSDPVAAADAAALAEALGVPGKPRADGDAWAVGAAGDGTEPVLRVGREAPGTWTFARYGSGGGDDCGKGRSCAGGTGAGDPSEAVSEREARTAAAPVLGELGLEDAEVDARQLMGAVRVVNAAPVYDGLPTYGWSTGIQVGPDGRVVGGSGHLTAPAKGDVYPLMSAGEALERLNSEVAGDGRVGIGECATTAPLEQDDVPRMPCASSSPAAPEPVAVEDAVLGLGVQFVKGRQTLVPSWLFTVRLEGAGETSTVTRTAVDPDFVARPESGAAASPEPEAGPGEARGPRVESYSADGKRLTVRFWGGVCSDYTARAREDGGTVTVEVTGAEREPGKACVMIAKELTGKVTLDAPLGGRRVVDGTSGETVPRA